MRRFALFSMVLICGLASAAFAEPITIPGTGVSFVAPTGFTPLTQAEVDAKFPSKRGPQFVLGNERRTTTVAYKLDTTVSMTPETLESGIGPIGDVIARVTPGTVWVDRKLMRLGGTEWAYFEFTSNAVDTEIHNIMLMGTWEGKLIAINFNATKEDFEEFGPVLKASIQSIAVERPNTSLERTREG